MIQQNHDVYLKNLSNPQFENFVQLSVLYISCDGAGALPAPRQHDLGQGGAALDEVLR